MKMVMFEITTEYALSGTETFRTELSEEFGPKVLEKEKERVEKLGHKFSYKKVD